VARHPFHHAREKSLLIVEVIVDESLAHSRFLRHLVHRQRRGTRRHNTTNRRAQNALRRIDTRTRCGRRALCHFSRREADDATRWKTTVMRWPSCASNAGSHPPRLRSFRRSVSVSSSSCARRDSFSTTAWYSFMIAKLVPSAAC